jgi:hypothetical protein
MSGAVLESDMSRFGLRRYHIAQMGKDLNPADWFAMIPPEVDRRDIKVNQYVEDPNGLDVHHLWLHWPVREVIRMMPADRAWQQMSAWWWLGTSDSVYPVSLAVDCAATLYRRSVGSWPVKAGIWALPKNASRTVQVQDAGESAALPLEVIDWVPERMVVVLGPKHPSLALPKSAIWKGETTELEVIG